LVSYINKKVNLGTLPGKEMWADIPLQYLLVARLAWMDESPHAPDLSYNIISLPASDLIGRSLVAGMLPPLCTCHANKDCTISRWPRQCLFGSGGMSMMALRLKYLCGPGALSMVNAIVFVPGEAWSCINIGIYLGDCVLVFLLIQCSTISRSV